jgi:hypothetical protein
MILVMAIHGIAEFLFRETNLTIRESANGHSALGCQTNS